MWRLAGSSSSDPGLATAFAALARPSAALTVLLSASAVWAAATADAAAEFAADLRPALVPDPAADKPSPTSVQLIALKCACAAWPALIWGGHAGDQSRRTRAGCVWERTGRGSDEAG